MEITAQKQLSFHSGALADDFGSSITNHLSCVYSLVVKAVAALWFVHALLFKSGPLILMDLL
jgi:hypothetical protein